MSWLSRLRNAVHPGRLDAELAAEIRDHLERRAAELNAQGLNREEAQRLASIRFGNATLMREESREIRLWAAIESTFQDIKYAWRGMRKSPAFASTAILSLSLAIGANTAIYSIVDAAILRPLPVPDPQSLFTLTTPGIEQPGNESSGESESFSYPLYQRFREATGNVARLALFSYPNLIEAAVTSGSPLEKLTRQYVSGEAFEILGIPPALGRVISKEDDRVPGAGPVLVLSYDYWVRRFGADRGVLGRNVLLQGKPFEIIGVAREGFFGIEPGRFVDVWVPAMMYDKQAFTNPGWGWFRIAGRLGPGASRERLQASLQPGFHSFQAEMIKQFGAYVPPAIAKQLLDSLVRVNSGGAGISGFRRTFARPLWVVLCVAAGILLIACANVGSLLLARSTARSAEMAMRVSLGAGRLRIVRQLLTESLLLSLAAGTIGWLLARAIAPMLVRMTSNEGGDPVRFVLAMDTRVLFFCAFVSTIAAVFFGLLPAWQAASAQPIAAIRGVSGQSGKLRLARLFVTVQVAFAFCIVIAGAGFLFSLRNLFAVDKGFDSRGVAVFAIGNDLSDKQTDVERHLIERVQTRVASMPGVQGAAVAPWGIFEGGMWTERVILPGKKLSVREEIFYRISPGYFATLRTPLLSGRDFSTRDYGDMQPIPTIVNRAFERKYFGGESALGKTFERLDEKGNVRHRVVGIAGDSHYGDLRNGPDAMVYLPMDSQNSFSLYVRSGLELGALARMVEHGVSTMGSGTRVHGINTLDTLVGNTLLREKLLAGVGGVFAFLGMLLAAIGVFGLLNYSVVRRTKELGIRAALGAQRREIILLVSRDLLAMVGGGFVAGLAGSVGVMTVLRSLLFGIRAADPGVIVTATAAFLAAAIIAGALPATRAAAIDPMVALRHE